MIHPGDAEGQLGELHLGAVEGYLGTVKAHSGAGGSHWSHGILPSITVAHPRAIKVQPEVSV